MKIICFCILAVASYNMIAMPTMDCISDVPVGGWSVDHKTNKLVLRRIEPGTFTMTGNRQVTISKPYYIGIYEVTQCQYEHFMGANLSHYRGATRPAEGLSYDLLRGPINGCLWPNSSDVDTNSVIAVIRTRLGCAGFDLPTEAQWEYAARAGATAALYNGKSRNDANLKGLARFSASTNDGIGGVCEHAPVGSYAPNDWGLYDVLGNVWEWCLDWHEGTWSCDESIDPLGAVTNENEYRCVRGGSWENGSYNCSLTYRGVRVPYSTPCGTFGFRIACDADALGLASDTEATYCILDLLGQDDHLHKLAVGDIRFGIGCASRFSYDNGKAFVIGVSGLEEKSFNARSDGTIVYQNDKIVDAEKRTSTTIDNYWCEQLTDINMMVWTGWARYAGFTNEDDFCDFFIGHPEINDNLGIIEWTLSQSPYRYKGQSDRATMKWAWAKSIDDCEIFFDRMTNWMNSANCLTYIQIDWVTPGTTNIVGSHAITCCGYVVKSGNSPVENVSHLFIINSDNDKSNNGGGRSAPNTITCVPVEWRSKYGRLFLKFPNNDGMIRFGCYQYAQDEVFRFESSDSAVYVSAEVSGLGDIVVSEDWLEHDIKARYGAEAVTEFASRFGSDLATALLKPTGKGNDVNGLSLCVWHDYIAGTNPVDSNDCFSVILEMNNGIPVLNWKPNLNGGSILCGQRKYTILGKTNLNDQCWHTPTNSATRFFKVAVDLP